MHLTESFLMGDKARNCNDLFVSARNNDFHGPTATPTISYVNPWSDCTAVASTSHRAFSLCNTMPPVQLVEFFHNKRSLALIATQPIPRGSIVFTERAMECVQLPHGKKGFSK
jgi:hypothetical protein